MNIMCLQLKCRNEIKLKIYVISGVEYVNGCSVHVLLLQYVIDNQPTCNRPPNKPIKSMRYQGICTID